MRNTRWGEVACIRTRQVGSGIVFFSPLSFVLKVTYTVLIYGAIAIRKSRISGSETKPKVVRSSVGMESVAPLVL